MTPLPLYGNRTRYQEYPLEVVRKHIHQEVQLLKLKSQYGTKKMEVGIKEKSLFSKTGQLLANSFVNALFPLCYQAAAMLPNEVSDLTLQITKE